MVAFDSLNNFDTVLLYNTCVADSIFTGGNKWREECFIVFTISKTIGVQGRSEISVQLKAISQHQITIGKP